MESAAADAQVPRNETTPIWDRPASIVHTCSSTLEGSRQTTVNRCLRELFVLCRQICTCAQGSCALYSNSDWFAPEVRQSKCAHADRCVVCRLFEQHREFEALYLSMLPTKNARLNQLLRCSSVVYDLYELAVPESSSETERERKTQVKELLCQLLDCGENRLNCLRNVGGLIKILPRLQCVQFKSGFSDFWTEMRKVATAVIHQTTRQCKLAAVLAFRRKLPPDSTWAFFLSTGSTEEEADILRQWLDAEITGAQAARP